MKKKQQKNPIVDCEAAKAPVVVAVQGYLALLVLVHRDVAGGRRTRVPSDAAEQIESWCWEA